MYEADMFHRQWHPPLTTNHSSAVAIGGAGGWCSLKYTDINLCVSNEFGGTIPNY